MDSGRESVLTFALDIVYPRRCAGCGARGTWLCDRCERATECFSGALCDGCGIPASLGLCRCEELPAAVARVRSVGPYGGWLRGSVVQVKYHGEWARVVRLAPMLAVACVDLLPIDALVPVPLHPTRQKQRGFNQSEKLSEGLSQEIAVPVLPALERLRKTAPQVRLGAERRQTNVMGAFGLLPGHEVAGKRLMLVDDVITTGSTVGACAEVLLAARAAVVNVLTVAREI